MGTELFLKVAEKYPFLTFFSYAGIEYVGVVQNRDTVITTFYDYGNILDPDQKRKFLDLANIWWWESNRSIPINIFLKQEWLPFKSYLKTFVNKDLAVLHGPLCSLAEMSSKKSKRKSITLVRRVD